MRFSFHPLPATSHFPLSLGRLVFSSPAGFLFLPLLQASYSPSSWPLSFPPFPWTSSFPPLPWVFRVFLSLRLLVSLAPSLLNARHAARVVKARCQGKVLKIKLVLTVLVLDLTVTGHLVSWHNQEFSSPLEWDMQCRLLPTGFPNSWPASIYTTSASADNPYTVALILDITTTSPNNRLMLNGPCIQCLTLNDPIQLAMH